MPRTKKFGHQKRRLIRKKTSVCVVSEKCDVSSSKKKMEKGKGYFDYENNFSAESQSRSFCFDVAENKSSRRGLASSISATCKYCGSSHGSMTSNSVPAGYENIKNHFNSRLTNNPLNISTPYLPTLVRGRDPKKWERRA
ncbi:hypothetical protein TNCT_286791 [Trichonephila clavata]|uniref:Uncharacterized protein n=1 Tax=Trichonephila clavata TaxID=2740835 RepID=A0A8X6F3L5_TRICU|nr:hypothetical protein TNCT_286791 [Trichonephila clavata]